ncbi:hypothetical protein AWU67_06185 [Microterricola viridarii]|uniref:Uncharacterized protein n=1 Tax=Microterricola viridarii TaxID=412690 RepID=A0A0X8E3V3_9MICO|nr:hypothetical protein AWU67_06185 [Microterricola viridarii]
MGRVNRLELDPRHSDAPLACRLVEHDTQLTVDVIAAGQGFFEIQPADDVTERRGGELLDGAEVVRDLIGCRPGIRHLEIHDGVDGDDEVVFGDDGLRREGDDLLAHVDQLVHPVDEGHEQVKPGCERLVVAAEAFDHAGVGLRDDLDRSEQDDEDKDDNDDDDRGQHDLRHGVC